MKKPNIREIKKLDFEISFYESILKENPGYIDVLIALGDNYTKRGFYEKGLDVDIKLSGLLPHDPVVHYNLACSYSLLNKLELAFVNLEKALKLGYSDFKWMHKDPDLENVRKNSKFILLLKNKPHGSPLHKT